MASTLCNICYDISLLAGDENKVTLLNTSGIVECLLARLLDEDIIIRRNSCMALTSISRHRQFCVPAIFSLFFQSTF